MAQFDKTIKRLATKEATDSCIDIFGDYAEDEIERLPPSIQNAWKAGQTLFQLEKEES
jgi:hypothetical protein